MKEEARTLLEVKNLTKTFGSFKALDHVDIAFKKGEVHALVGENGAGKSTLIKCVCGAHPFDSGSMSLDGKDYEVRTPFDAFQAGITTMYQEFNLLADLSVTENLFLGREDTKKSGLLQKKEMQKQTQALLDELSLPISENTKIRSLPAAQKQMVEIMKGIKFNSRLIFMDEPSAILTETEVDALFAIIRKLVKRGITIVYVSHRMDEIFQIADTLTVLKDGAHVITAPIGHFKGKEDVAQYMIGRRMDSHYFSEDIPHAPDRTCEVLRVEHLKNDDVNDVSFSLYKGEILGLSGLVGSGRSEIIQAIFGATPLKEGNIYLHGKKVKIPNPHAAIKNGLAYVPEERALQGIILDASIKENLSISIPDKIYKYGLLQKKTQEHIVSDYTSRLNVKMNGIDAKAKSLSGGNQQKAILAKWLATDSEILILDEPTRGIDVGSKAEIYKILARIAAQGFSIIVVSSEMPEIMNICDRILVVSNHRIVDEMLAQEATEARIMTSILKGIETPSNHHSSKESST